MMLDSGNTCSSFTSTSSYSLSLFLSLFLSCWFFLAFLGKRPDYPDYIRRLARCNFVFFRVLKYSNPRTISFFTTDLVSFSYICPNHRFFRFTTGSLVYIALLRFNINYKLRVLTSKQLVREEINVENFLLIYKCLKRNIR